MHLNRFDLNLLVALDALLRERNVTRAAERVHVAQPTMSTALHRLREYFNDPLLIRVGRDLELTPRGLAIVGPVREALLQVQAILGTQAIFHAATATRSFTIAMADYWTIDLAPRILQRLAIESPGLKCQIEQLRATSASRLEHGDADLYIGPDISTRLGRKANPEAFLQQPIAKIQWTCAVGADNPLAGETLTMEQFRELPLLFVHQPDDTTSVEERVRELLSTPVKIAATAPSHLAAAWIVATSPYLALWPERFARGIAERLPLVLLPSPIQVPEHFDVMMWHRRNEADPGHAWLRQIIADVALIMMPSS